MMLADMSDTPYQFLRGFTLAKDPVLLPYVERAYLRPRVTHVDQAYADRCQKLAGAERAAVLSKRSVMTLDEIGSQCDGFKQWVVDNGLGYDIGFVVCLAAMCDVDAIPLPAGERTIFEILDEFEASEKVSR